MTSRRLESPPSLAGMFLRVLHDECRGQGCARCAHGFVWRSTYAEGRGEQGDDFEDLDVPPETT